MIEIRKIALGQFGENNIRKGEPYASLEEVLVPVYFFHRYQAEATSKLLGGLNYRYALRGDGQMVTEFVPREEEDLALRSLIRVVRPEALALSEDILTKLPPRSLDQERTRELARIRTTLTFDALGIAEAAVDMTYGLVFHPSRAGRLVEYHARDSRQMGLEDVIDAFVGATWKSERKTGYFNELQHVSESRLLEALFRLGVDPAASDQVHAIVNLRLQELEKWLNGKAGATLSAGDLAHFTWAGTRIRRYREDPDEYKSAGELSPPDGSPIGCW